MMNIVEEIIGSKFLLILLGEEQYANQLYDVVKSVKKTKNKICYVCLSKPYSDVLSDLKKNGVKTGSFVFIDVLSSHYGKPEARRNCIFLDSPSDLGAMKEAIERAVEKEKCSVLLFDTISALLIYQESFPILQFTHIMATERKQKNVKKVFIVLKKGYPEKENEMLTDDLKMFADKTLEVE